MTNRPEYATKLSTIRAIINYIDSRQRNIEKDLERERKMLRMGLYSEDEFDQILALQQGQLAELDAIENHLIFMMRNIEAGHEKSLLESFS